MTRYPRLLGLLLAVVVGCGVLSACGGPYVFRGREVHPPFPAPDIALTDHHGQPYRLHNQQGRVIIVVFGFTACPDVCPTTLADLAEVRRRLGDDAADVQVILITVDPDRDTQAVLASYVGLFDPSFIGLRGDSAATARVLRDYGVAVAKTELPGSALGYTMDHPTRIYGIDRGGSWRVMFSTGDPLDDLVRDLRYLVQERAE